MPSLAAEQRQTRKRALILLWLEGGASPWETFTPMDDRSPVEFRGGMPTVQTALPGVRVSQHLPQVASLLDRCTLVRTATSESGDHFISADRLLREGKSEPGAQTFGELHGSSLATGGVPYTFLNMPGQYQNDDATLRCHRPAQAMRFDWCPKRQCIPPPSVRIDAETQARQRERRALLEAFDTGIVHAPAAQQMDRTRQTAFDLLSGSGSYFKAFETSAAERRAFGERDPGKNPLACAAAVAHKMVMAGAGIVTIHHCHRQGWDAHSEAEKRLPSLLDELDGALSELIRRSRADGFSVVCTSEFGRTPRINGGGGRDHHDVHFLCAAGQGWKQGAVHGTLKPKGEIADGAVTNQVLANTMLAACGLELSPAKPRLRDVLE
jgi:uncharacterized protein (DUF1501 family)